MKFCTKCGEPNSSNRKFCGKCGFSSDLSNNEISQNNRDQNRYPGSKIQFKDRLQPSSFSYGQYLGMIGSIILLLSIFMPLVKFPILGGISLIALDTLPNDENIPLGFIIIVISIISFKFAFSNMHYYLKNIGYGCASSSVILFLAAYIGLLIYKDELIESLNDGFFRGFTELVALSIQLDFGWVYLILGSVLIMIGGILSEKN